jgi:hypothetical protein
LKNSILVDASVFSDPRIESLCEKMNGVQKGDMNGFEMVGRLVALWSSVLNFEASGVLGIGLMSEIASETLSESPDGGSEAYAALVSAGLVCETSDGMARIVGWGAWTGSVPAKRRRKSEQMARYRAKCSTLQAPKCSTLQGQPPEKKQEPCSTLHKSCSTLQDSCSTLQGGLLEEDSGVRGVSGEDAQNGDHNLILSNTILYNYSNSKDKNSNLLMSKEYKISKDKNSNSEIHKKLTKIPTLKKKNYVKKESCWSVSEVESGSADGLAASKAVCDADVLMAFASVHREVWGGRVSSKSAGIKKAAKTLMVCDSWSPSDICKAIRGMGRDDWGDRKKYNGWSYLVKGFEKWLSLFEGGGDAISVGTYGEWRDHGFATQDDWEEHRGRSEELEKLELEVEETEEANDSSMDMSVMMEGEFTWS